MYNTGLIITRQSVFTVFENGEKIQVSTIIFSISAVQWLCNADKKSHNPAKRMLKFFTTLYACMVSVIQS